MESIDSTDLLVSIELIGEFCVLSLTLAFNSLAAAVL